MAFRDIDECIFAQSIHSHFDFTEFQFELAAFTAWQYRRAEMIAHLELQARLVVDDQSGFGVDFSDINTFG
ncbi:hypothetical protein ALQ26_02089 [Pseudomonas amygdali pv. lachrymans]|nr:hypothetical protein ALQ26_02089 [Pseudomonas amygdali pv. lachrymans]